MKQRRVAGLVLLCLVCAHHCIAVAENTRVALVSDLARRLSADPDVSLSAFRKLAGPVIDRLSSSDLHKRSCAHQTTQTTTQQPTNTTAFQKLMCDAVNLLSSNSSNQDRAEMKTRKVSELIERRLGVQYLLQVQDPTRQDSIWFSAIYIGITGLCVVLLVLWHGWVSWFCTLGSENILIRNQVLGSASLLDAKGGRQSPEYKTYVARLRERSHSKSESWQEVTSTDQPVSDVGMLEVWSESGWQTALSSTKLAGVATNSRGWCRYFSYTRLVVFICVIISFLDAINAVFELGKQYSIV